MMNKSLAMLLLVSPLCLIADVTLETQWQDVPDTNTVGSVLNLGNGPVFITNAANGAIARYDATNLASRISAKYTKPDTGIPMTDLKTDLQQTIYGKQDALVSGTNIKTINNQSVLGSGNISIEMPSHYTTTNQVCNLITNNVAPWAMYGKSEPQGITTNDVLALTSAKRDLTNNVCAADSFTAWGATPPSGYTFGDAQPVFNGDTEKWTWYVEGEGVAVDAESGASTASATSATFTFEDSGTKTFTATRSKVAVSNDTFTTYAFVKTITNGLASAAWVTAQNYVDKSVTNGLASETWVTNKIAQIPVGTDTNAVKGIVESASVTNAGAYVAATNAAVLKSDGGPGVIGWHQGIILPYLSYSENGNDRVAIGKNQVGDLYVWGEDWRTLWNDSGTLQSALDAKANTNSVYTKSEITGNTVTNGGAKAYADSLVYHTNVTFSNEVLAVGFGVSSNDVAVIREMVGTIGDLPVGGGAATLGGLLAALVAAVVWLKQNALRKGLDSSGVPTDANVSTLFSSANTSLVGEINYTIGGSGNPADHTVRTLGTLSTATTLTIAAPRKSGALRDFAITFTEPSTAVGVTFSTTDSASNALTFYGEFLTPAASTTYIYYLTEIATNTFLVKGEEIATVTPPTI